MSGKTTSTIKRPETPPRASDQGRSRLGDVTRPVSIDRRLTGPGRSTVLLGLAALLIAGALAAALFVLPVAVTGCNKSSEKLLKEQSDQVCACSTFDCAMKVLKGPINQELKTRKGKLSEEGRKEKQRMMKCIFALKAKEAK